jgi:methionine-R-sulfoxide reductase
MRETEFTGWSGTRTFTAAGLLVLGVAAAWGCDQARDIGGQVEAAPAASQPADTVTVRVIGADGRLSEPIAQPRVRRSEDQWRQILTDQQFRVLRQEGTEAPFTCDWLDARQDGFYVCAGCELPLFASTTKFKSGTGWPSYFEPVAGENVREVVDRSHGMTRTEVECTRCGGHLGHVFTDGPKPTGLRYCINGAALKFVARADPAEAATRPVAR